ncbi:sensor histidine kinase [Bordetella ansorpii]|uniref:sensor histidine kinase n=1 Tax=Bordetella ansorpii TaxID=288768 RepID=UPI0018D337F6|nr:ATP-binding protein [Bordetella ansorpii]
MLCLFPLEDGWHGSPSAADMLGGIHLPTTHPEQLLALVHQDDRAAVARALDQARLGAPCIGFSARVGARRGSPRHLRYAAHARRTPAGTLEYVGILLDETAQMRSKEDLRHLQAQLEALSRSSTLGKLAAAIAHEMRQPLAAIGIGAGAAQRWLDRSPPDYAEAASSMKSIQRDSLRAQGVLDSIMALVQRGSPTYQTLRLHTLLGDARLLVQWLASDNDVRIEADVPQTLPAVQGDPIQLQQVLLNLLINAVQAVRGNTGRQAPRVAINGRVGPGRRLFLDVSDNGPGIPPDLKERIFEPFFSTRPEGMGMGLWLCRRIALGHGGELLVVPETPGATLRLVLPVSRSGGAGQG